MDQVFLPYTFLKSEISMKILLILLTMIFLGFNANAYTVKIMSEKCKKYELTKLKTNKLYANEKKMQMCAEKLCGMF